MKRRNRIVGAITTVVVAVSFGAVPAGAGRDSISAELGSSAAKRGTVVLDVTGTVNADSVTALKSTGDVIIRVPVPQEITSPDACTQDTPQQFTCDVSLGIEGLRGFMGPAKDRFVAQSSVDITTNQFGGPGNDVLKGGSVFDFLNGQRGNDDRCRGRQGPETIKKCE